ncbi:MAG: MaoC/PaaZ C-terminal domain-containing protein, partial [bacterium]
IAYFMGIDKVRFRKPVVPGDQLYMEGVLMRKRPSSCKMAGKAYVNDTLVCEAEFMCAIVDK